MPKAILQTLALILIRLIHASSVREHDGRQQQHKREEANGDLDQGVRHSYTSREEPSKPSIQSTHRQHRAMHDRLPSFSSELFPFRSTTFVTALELVQNASEKAKRPPGNRVTSSLGRIVPTE